MEKEKAICGMWHITKNELQVNGNSAKGLSNIRNKLEPFVFNALEQLYGAKLTEFWKTYTPPKKAKKAFMITEGRIHPNLWFVLRNIAWAGPDMAVYIFCSDQNYDYIISLLGDKAPHFNVIVAFNGDPPKEQAMQEYNNFLTSYTTYQLIDAEYVMTIQMDVYLRKRLEDHLFHYDYMACRWAWKSDEPGGAVSIRRISKMIELCQKARPDLAVNCNIPEDEFINRLIISNNCLQAPVMENIENLLESIHVFTTQQGSRLITDPYVVHQAWTFSWTFTREQFTQFWQKLLVIHI
jgi:hypothetical protein